MSTRANVVIKDGFGELIFYRHSDGYPECTGEDLKKFVLDYSPNGHLRPDAMQSSGWLIIRGYLDKNYQNRDGGYAWKVGAYEPTPHLHGDAEYVYVIDLDERSLEAFEPIGRQYWDSPKHENLKLSKQFKRVRF